MGVIFACYLDEEGKNRMQPYFDLIALFATQFSQTSFNMSSQSLLSYLLFSYFILLPLFSQAQKEPYNPEKLFSPEELQEDLNVFWRHLQEVHPGLFTYTSQRELEIQLKDIRAQLTEPMTELAFFRLLSPILKPIGNGHTNIRVSDAFRKHHRTELLLFPLSVQWLDESLYLFRDLSTEKKAPLGAKILRINGMQADSLFLAMRTHVTRDGYNLTGPNRSIAGSFRHWFSYLIGNPERFRLDLRLADSSPQTFEVAAELYPTIIANYEERFAEQIAESDKEPLLHYEIEEDIAIMTIQTFSKGWAKSEGIKFPKFYEKAFGEIAEKGVKHLIIDLRSNGGGDPEPTIDLFGYLHPEPFTFYREISLITRNIPDNRLYKDKLFLQELLIPFRTKKEGDIYHVKGIAGTKIYPPLSPRFDGPVYVLINGSSFSATGEMTAILKEHDRVVFVGEEAGGNPVQNTSGIMLQLVLPHTKLNVTNPAVLWKMNVSFENTGHGVVPDYPVSLTIEGLLARKDEVMEFTKKLIRGGGAAPK